MWEPCICYKEIIVFDVLLCPIWDRCFATLEFSTTLLCDQIPPKYDKKSFSQRPLLGPECGKIQSQSTWLSVRAKDYVAKGFYWNASNIGSKQHKNHKHSQFCQVIYLKYIAII